MADVIDIVPAETDDRHDLLGCYANIWIRQKKFLTKGQMIGGHTHRYDHMSLLASGKVKVEANGVEHEYEAPAFLIIRKDVVHNVTALSEGVVWFCLFANRDVEGEVYDPEVNDPLYDSSVSSHRVGQVEQAELFTEEVRDA